MVGLAGRIGRRVRYGLGVFQMSLINQMLQELDARGTNAGAVAGGVLQGQIRAVPERRGLHPAWWIVLVLAIFLSAAGGWIWLGRGSAPTPAQKALLEKVDMPLKLAGELEMNPSPPAPSIRPQIEAPKEAAPASIAPPPIANDKPVQVSLASAPPMPLSPPAAAAEKSKAEKSVAPTDAPSASANVQHVTPPASPSVALSPAVPAQSVTPDTAKQVALNKQVKELTPQLHAENEYRRGSTLAQQGRSAEAIAALETALQLDPQHAAARQTLVALLIEAKRQDDAIRRLREGLQLDPSQAGMATILARLQVDRGELKPAIETLQRSSSYADDRADYQAFLAALLQRDGRHRDAIDRYALALKRSPQNGIWWMGQGISLQAENRTAEAIDAYNRAKASGSLSPDLRAYVEEKLSGLQH
jgi:MSHA biogenesis protein MshN